MSSLARLTTQPWLTDLCDFPPEPAVYNILLSQQYTLYSPLLALYSEPDTQTALAGYAPTQSGFEQSLAVWEGDKIKTFVQGMLLKVDLIQEFLVGASFQ